jgi:hypothetical protein
MKLDVKALALTSGLVWGAGVFLLTLWIIAFDGPAPADAEPPFLGLLYRGYRLTYAGSLIGGVWAFADGLLGGAVFAWLYNKLAAPGGSAARRPGGVAP